MKATHWALLAPGRKTRKWYSFRNAGPALDATPYLFNDKNEAQWVKRDSDDDDQYQPPSKRYNLVLVGFTCKEIM